MLARGYTVTEQAQHTGAALRLFTLMKPLLYEYFKITRGIPSTSVRKLKYGRER